MSNTIIAPITIAQNSITAPISIPSSFTIRSYETIRSLPDYPGESIGGNGASDSGKLATFTSDGHLGVKRLTVGSGEVKGEIREDLLRIKDFLSIYIGDIITENLTANRTYVLPNNDGVFAMTSDLHNAVTVTGNGISLSGQQISLDIGTGATQIAAGNHTHSGVYQPVLSSYSTISALSGYPASFATTAADISDATTAGRALLTAANAAAQRTSLGLGTSDAPAFAGLTVDGTTLVVDAANHKIGIGTTTVSDGSSLTIYRQLTSDGQTGAMIDVNPGTEARGIKMGAIRIGGRNYPGIWMGQTSPTVTNYAFLQDDGAQATLFNTPNYSNMQFRVGNATQILLSSNGNVGIGTTTPTYKTEVAGSGATSGIRSHMGFDVYPVPPPAAGSVTGVVSAGGSVDTGTHYYAVTYTTSTGETTARYSAAITTTAGNNTVTLAIPVSTDPRVTGRKIYRTKAGTSSYMEYLLATVDNNTATTYVDTAADSTLPGLPGVVYHKTNTTSNGISVNGTRAITLDSNGVFIGIGSGANLTTGGRNTLVGSGAGNSLSTGSDNAFFGTGAGQNQTSASTNTLIGTYAGTANTTGSGNTALGGYALFSNQTGASNTCVGASAGQSITGGSNTAIGRYSLLYNTTGTENIAIGASSGQSIASGSNNTTPSASIYIGYDTRALSAGGTNEIVIGGRAVGNGSNTVTIGNGSTLRNVLQKQLDLQYDASNYISVIVGSTGGVTFSNAGTTSDVWTYNGNAVFNGLTNRMPNQTAATADSVITRSLGDIRYQTERQDGFHRFTDFPGTNNTGWMTPDVRNGGGGAAQANHGYNANPAIASLGVWKMDTNTQSNGSAGLNGSVTILGYFQDLTYETRINLPTAPTATENFRVCFGFCSSYASTVDPFGAAYNLCFYASSAYPTWQILENNNGSYALTDTTVAVAYGSEYRRLKIRVTGTSATFYLNDVLVGTKTIVSGMTTAILNPVLLIAKTAGLTSRTLNCDWVEMIGNGNTRT